MRLTALALVLLCQAAHGQPRKQQNTIRKPLQAADRGELNAQGAAIGSPGIFGRKCEDGENCNSEQCQKLANADVCDNVVPTVRAATSPQGKNLNVEQITGPFCVTFNNTPDTEGFAPCPGNYDNIEVSPSDISPYIASPYNDNAENPLSGDTYLHLRDESGGSLACGTGAEYTGDWTSFANTKCHELCFDVKLFYDGCHSGVSTCSPSPNTTGYFIEIYPALILQGGPPNFYRAVFRAYDFMTDEDGSSPDWRRICAPLAPLNSTGDLPSNEFGYWYMSNPNDILSGSPPITGPPSPNTAWPDLLADVAAIQLPIDFTGNPAERAGYDNICLKERDCEDLCDPEPLCYWQHEWNCEDAKKEEWHGNFTDLVSSLETFPRKFCICKILKDCCPDLCDIAEQEFTALLLNVASGQLSLECGIEECDDCVHNVSSIISMVDELLAPSSRSDYDCSKALQYLTGINHDVTLCDTPAVSEPCPQTEECFTNDGMCVPRETCVPGPTVSCEDHYCLGSGGEGECTCKMDIPCPQTTQCEEAKGRCIKNCMEIAGEVECKDICTSDDDPTGGNSPDKCLCEIKNPPCQQTTLCENNGGQCVKEEDCDPVTSNCSPQFCDFSEGCICRIPDTSLPCEDNGCAEATGECVKDCFPIAGVRKCDPDLCINLLDDPTEACYCKLEKKCEDVNNWCQDMNGNCKIFDDCDSVNYVCDPDLCGNGNKCVCEYLPNGP